MSFPVIVLGLLPCHKGLLLYSFTSKPGNVLYCYCVGATSMSSQKEILVGGGLLIFDCEIGERQVTAIAESDLKLLLS